MPSTCLRGCFNRRRAKLAASWHRTLRGQSGSSRQVDAVVAAILADVRRAVLEGTLGQSQ